MLWMDDINSKTATMFTRNFDRLPMKSAWNMAFLSLSITKKNALTKAGRNLLQLRKERVGNKRLSMTWMKAFLPRIPMRKSYSRWNKRAMKFSTILKALPSKKRMFWYVTAAWDMLILMRESAISSKRKSKRKNYKPKKTHSINSRNFG